MIFDGVNVEVSGGKVTDDEIGFYIDCVRDKFLGKKIESLNISIDGDYANLDFIFTTVPFQRIRRITGYLVGDTSRWNNGKYAELLDRQKHVGVGL
jgi:hypothetical protein